MIDSMFQGIKSHLESRKFPQIPVWPYSIPLSAALLLVGISSANAQPAQVTGEIGIIDLGDGTERAVTLTSQGEIIGGYLYVSSVVLNTQRFDDLIRSGAAECLSPVYEELIAIKLEAGPNELSVGHPHYLCLLRLPNDENTLATAGVTDIVESPTTLPDPVFAGNLIEQYSGNPGDLFSGLFIIDHQGRKIPAIEINSQNNVTNSFILNPDDTNLGALIRFQPPGSQTQQVAGFLEKSIVTFDEDQTRHVRVYFWRIIDENYYELAFFEVSIESDGSISPITIHQAPLPATQAPAIGSIEH